MHDADGDGRLSFDEFFKLSQEHGWLVRDWCVKYCRYVVPRRNAAITDETGKYRKSLSRSFQFYQARFTTCSLSQLIILLIFFCTFT